MNPTTDLTMYYKQKETFSMSGKLLPTLRELGESETVMLLGDCFGVALLSIIFPTPRWFHEHGEEFFFFLNNISQRICDIQK